MQDVTGTSLGLQAVLLSDGYKYVYTSIFTIYEVQQYGLAMSLTHILAQNDMTGQLLQLEQEQSPGKKI
jgi:hypothetical protein